MPRGIIRLGAKDQKELLKWLGYSGAKIVGSRVFGPTKSLDIIIDSPKVKAEHGELPELSRGKYEEQEEEPKNIRDLD